VSTGASKIPSMKAVFVEASEKLHTAGSAVNSRVEIRLEDHPIKNPVKAKLVDFIADLDIEGKGWYLASLDTPTRIFRDPVTEVLLFAQGTVDHPASDRPAYDDEGRQISYYYRYPLEEMLLNEKSKIKYVIAQIGTIKDPVILIEKRLVHNQIRIYPRVTIWKTSD